MSASAVKCSLCNHLISETELRTHHKDEMRELVEPTISLIKSRHPKWSQNDPTCQLCWDFYYGLPSI